MAASKPVGRPQSLDPEITESSAPDTGSGFPNAAPAEPVLGPPKEPGELGTLGPYRVQKKIGIGGMGVVYLGFDESLHRNVALKVMLPKVAENAVARERFLREARASAAVEHPNVVGIFSVGEHQKVPYLAMQYLQGQPLDKYLAKKGPPGLAQIMRLAREIVDGLAAAHAKGLIHRDIKPANLWLEAPHGRIKILDFGLAKPSDEKSGEITHTGTVVGTPAYMAPEQARALPVDFRTDLFSVGAVLYRVCTGRQPFAGATVMAVLSALAVDTPVPVRELNPAIPQALADLIHKLLEKDPNQRPKSAAEVSAALKAIEKSLAGSGPQPAPPQFLPQSGPLALPLPPQYAPAPYLPIPVPHDENTFANLDGGSPTEPMAAHRSKTTPKLAALPKGKKKPPLAFFLCGGVAVILLTGLAFLAFGKKAKVEPAPEVEVVKPPEKPKPQVVAGPMKKFGSNPPIAESWIASTRKAALAEQVQLVERELRFRNQRFDGKLDYRASDGVITSVKLNADEVADLTPLQGLAGLTSVSCVGSTAPNGQLFDLAPLTGLPITALNLANNNDLNDLKPLKDLPLLSLNISNTGVTDLAPLSGKDLDSLNLSNCKISDLQPLAGGKYDALNLTGTAVAKLAPLASCTIKDLLLNSEHAADLSPLVRCGLEKLRIEPATAKFKASAVTALRDVKSLKEIQGLPAATFWRYHDGRMKAKLEPLHVLAAHAGEVMGAAYSADGKQYATLGKDNKVKVWDAAEPVSPRVIAVPAPCFQVAFVPGTDLIATRSATAVRFWKARGELDGGMIALPHESGGFAFSADGKRLVIAPWLNAAKDYRIHLYDLPDRKAVEPIADWAGSVRHLTLSSDGRAAYLSGDAGKAAVYDLATRKLAHRFSYPDMGNCTAACFSRDNAKILFAAEQGFLAIVDWQKGSEVSQFRSIPHTCAAIAPGDRQIILGTRDGWLAVLDAATGAPLGHAFAGSSVKSIVLSPNSERILTAHMDGTVREWDGAKLCAKSE